MKLKFNITSADHGKTIRQFFAEKGYSGTTIKKFKYDGEIAVNGQREIVNYVLREGDVLSLVTNDGALHPEPSQTAAQICYVDEFLYVCDKPYGINTHPDRANREDTLANRLSANFGNDFTLRIVTRLDKTTSGLVLGALDEVTAEKLNAMQQKHEIHKTYLALVCGILPDDHGEIRLPLARVDEQNKTVVDEHGKPSATTYTVLRRNADTTLVELHPLTGRTHQLRAHMSAIGYPIVGDVLYGGTPDSRIMLHCAELVFAHPMTNKLIQVSSPLPKEFNNK